MIRGLIEHVKPVIKIWSAFQIYNLLILNVTPAKPRFCVIVLKLLQVERAAHAVYWKKQILVGK